jgi:hypothetical protein
MVPSPHTGFGRMIGILLAMFLAVLGIDFLFNAGILAHFYLHPGPAISGRVLKPFLIGLAVLLAGIVAGLALQVASGTSMS